MKKFANKLINYLKLFTVIVCCTLLTGCVSYYSKRGINDPLNVVQSAVKRNLPEGVMWVSHNHREMKSNYFHPGHYNKKYESTPNRIFRAQAYVWILGDRRPYHLKLKVYLELRVSGGPRQVYSQRDLTIGKWTYAGTESVSAKSLGKIIHDYLLKMDREWDLIDNFRPY